MTQSTVYDNIAHDGMRLQRFLARSGVASRRHSETLILDGRVSVNGVIVTTLGTRVYPGDEVRLDGVPVFLNSDASMLMLNKPSGVLSAMSDDRGRTTLSDLLGDAYKSFFHVGRLDIDTTGLLLITNDGELGNALTHPKYHVWKTYEVTVTGRLQEEAVQALADGVMLDDGLTAPSKVGSLHFVSLKNNEVATVFNLSIREGKNRQIKRMCEAVGHPVISLHRKAFGPLELGDLSEGSFRMLSDEEILALRNCINKA
ncbi:MAG: rRNA pseudouridine synthase [Eggerthellaceae bacterium]|nr:rRNA pseudouridine synthase [Eggerthellaceae bacterium]